MGLAPKHQGTLPCPLSCSGTSGTSQQRPGSVPPETGHIPTLMYTRYMSVGIYPVSPISSSSYTHRSMYSCLPHILLFIQSCSPYINSFFLRLMSSSVSPLSGGPFFLTHSHSMPFVIAQYCCIPPKIGTRGR